MSRLSDETTLDSNEQRTEQHVFSSGEIRQWDAGEGVIVRPDGWSNGYIPMLDDQIRARVDSILGPEQGVKSIDSEQHKQIESQPADD